MDLFVFSTDVIVSFIISASTTLLVAFCSDSLRLCMKGIFIALLVLACMAFLQLERSNQSNVLEARAGYYEKPIATIDFASLYPSIMMAYNLCYCTLVTPEDVRKLNLPPESVNKTPSGETFVKSNLQKASIGMDNLNA